jgi:hypothetical protein
MLVSEIFTMEEKHEQPYLFVRPTALTKKIQGFLLGSQLANGKATYGQAFNSAERCIDTDPHIII